MDGLDEKILVELQYDFPLSERPYDIIAQKLEVGIEELWRRIEAMLDSGVIRRIGVSLDSNKLGFRSTLAAVRVPEDSVEKAAEVIGRYHEVTHSYLRDDAFNIWFTVIAPSEESIAQVLGEIRQKLSLKSEDVLYLPLKRLFKLDARFESSK